MYRTGSAFFLLSLKSPKQQRQELNMQLLRDKFVKLVTRALTPPASYD